ncbi:ROK family protein [Larkinella terrae]|uniref:ROK family protein n=1 Tax=Larkinella terrae TaxID=2025311 RepID=A0A7K0ESY5_9BACT|nr:ROK family protein [Larkinella terrae]MRS64930.1 ROK family protein [Larkinella terrae]
MNAIGIDIGGTRIKGVLIETETGAVLHRVVCSTNDGEGGQWKQAVADTFQQLKTAAGESVLRVGLSAPGLPTPANDAIACMPGRLPGLEGFVWSDFLGTPVRVLNDAHAALMAEARYGAAKDIRNALMLTLGTGVGGGLLIDGNLYQGYYQMAGHLGHVTVDAGNNQLGITNMPGNLEDAIGNATVVRRSYGRYQTTQELVDAYRKNEPLATLVWLTSVRQLAVTIAGFANAFSPEVVVLGGGIMQAGDALFGPLEAYLEVFEWRPAGKKTAIRKAHFEDWAGAIGAAGFVGNEMY